MNQNDNLNLLREEIQMIVMDVLKADCEYRHDGVQYTYCDPRVTPAVLKVVGDVIAKIKSKYNFNPKYDKMIEQMIVESCAVEIAKARWEPFFDNEDKFVKEDYMEFVDKFVGRAEMNKQFDSYIKNKKKVDDVKISLELMVTKELHEFAIAEKNQLSELYNRKNRVDFAVNSLCEFLESKKERPDYNIQSAARFVMNGGACCFCAKKDKKFEKDLYTHFSYLEDS